MNPGSKNPISAKKAKSKKSKKKFSHEEMIDSFEDQTNPYLTFFTNKINNLKKKVSQAEKIQKKISAGKEVQREEMEIIENKEKFLFSIEQFKKAMFRMKEIAYEEQKEKTNAQNEQKTEQKMLEESHKNEIKKLEKELKTRLELQKENEIEKLTANFKEKLRNVSSESQNNSIKFVTEFYFVLIFLESISKNELLSLLNEINNSNSRKTSEMQNSENVGEETLYLTSEEISTLKTFLYKIFPSANSINIQNSTKEELTISVRTLNQLFLKSKDPINPISSQQSNPMSFDSMQKISHSIAQSAIFYNRFPLLLKKELDPSSSSDKKLNKEELNIPRFNIPGVVPDSTTSDVGEQKKGKMNGGDTRRGRRGRRRGRRQWKK